jgi:beta-galactosidase
MTMSKWIFSLAVWLVIASVSFAGVTSFDDNWKFAQDDFPEAQNTEFDDAAWQTVHVPHDWIIALTPDKSHPGAQGSFPGGTAWYRKHFTMNPADNDKKVFVEFDGIMRRSTVYINGTELGTCSYGYTPLQFDLTPYINWNGNNVLAVRVNTGGGTRWYSGGGIYRHVYFKVLNKVHVDLWGTYITTPNVTASSADVNVKTKVKNENTAAQNCALKTTVLDVDGAVLTSIESARSIAPGATYEFSQDMTVGSPKLWSPSTPSMYKAISEVSVDGKVVDTYETPFGIRTIDWDSEQGLLLNGRSIKIKGTNLHHDMGILGAAFNARSWERRLAVLKSLGYNGIRTGHHSMAREFLDLCDRMGFLVLNETHDKWERDIYPNWEADWQRDLGNVVLRDRNHPCVYLWSVGNESRFNQIDEFSKFYTPMANWIHQHDYRKVTVGLGPTQVNPASVLDIVSQNYLPEWFPIYRAAYPDVIINQTETNMYWRDAAMKNANAWIDVMSYPYVVGSYQWTGIEYLGESGWPSKGWRAAGVDISGFPKPVAYLSKSMWTTDPMVHVIVEDSRVVGEGGGGQWSWPHMADHWTHPTLAEDPATTVKVYSNCESVELFINGVSQGIKYRMAFDDYIMVWNVDYAPGTIKAVGRIGGTAVCQQAVKTAGPANKIVLTPDRSIIRAEGKDRMHVEVNVTDASGTLIPDAAHDLTFSVTGPATIIATGNSDLRSDFRLPKAYRGKCLVVLQSTGAAGAISLTASAEGLTSASMNITAVSATAETPYLFGLDQASAESKITRGELSIGKVTEAYDEEVVQGQVLNQNPAHGTIVGTRTPVDFVISKGPAPRTENYYWIYQAEDATLSGCSTSSDGRWWYGTGFVDFKGGEGYIEWTVNAPDEGIYHLSFRYAGDDTSDRPMQLSINGTTAVNSMSLPPTTRVLRPPGGGAYPSGYKIKDRNELWLTVQTVQTLKAGSNTIRLSTTGKGGANIDQLVVVRESPTTIPVTKQQTGTFTDPRDGKTYKTVKIGKQVWMAENLAFKPKSGNYWAYDNNSSNVAKYGYLYDWQTARDVCPKGWRLPSDAEWTELTDFVGTNPGTKLKAKSGWTSTGNGTDDYGFSASPGGGRYYLDGSFLNLGNYGDWWSSTENDDSNAWSRSMSSNSGNVYRDNFGKWYGFSVRCVRDH